MKKLIITCLLVTLTTPIFSQAFDVDTLVWNGPGANRINFVILSDGYQADELNEFILKANSFTDEMFSQSPYKEYANFFNVMAIKVPSNESGATHPGTATDVNEPVFPVSYVDNYFGSTFDSFDIHRLLDPLHTGNINMVLGWNFPTFDISIVMVNSPYYGGSGGLIPAFSTDPNSFEVGLHEMGHSFAHLKDEYYAGDALASEGINMTQETDPEEVRWANWMGDEGVGIYQYSGGGEASSWYRPHQNCKMRYLGSPFCAVCRQGIIEKIHSLVSLLDWYSPANESPIAFADSMLFKIGLVKPIPNTLKTDWTLNGENLAHNLDSISLAANNLAPGINELEVMIEDTSQLLRVDSHEIIHFSSLLWTIDQSTLRINDVTQNAFSISIFPNPVADILSVQFTGSTAKSCTIVISDITGKQLISTRIARNDTPTAIDVGNLPAGVYVVSARIDGHAAMSQKIIKN